MPASWKVGTITVPSGTGSQSITGLGGTPKAVFFYGTNWLTEDAADTASGRGLFRGMACPQYNSPGTLLENAASVVIPGDSHSIQNTAILMLNTAGGGTNLYGANLTSLDADGFTLNWFAAAAGGYKVIYIALMDVTNCGAYRGVNGVTPALGYKAGAALHHGAWAGPVTAFGDRTQEFYGGGAYPGSAQTGWYGAGLSAFTLPTAPGGGQRNIGIFNFGPHIVTAQGGHFTGPFLVTSNIRAFPSGGSLTDFTWDGDNQDGGMVVMWDDEDSRTGRLTPATSEDGTVTVSGLPFKPGLLIGYSVSDEPQGQGSGNPNGLRGAVGFSVVTPDFQWSALSDGRSNRGAYQSFQRGVIDVINGSSVHAATIELTDDGFIVTTEEDDVAPATWVWHIFGGRKPVAWLPHIYRVVRT